MLCVRAWTVRVSVDFAGLGSHVFHWWWEGLFIPAATWCFAIVFYWITADRAISSNFVGCKPISPADISAKCCWVEEYCKTALVQLVLQENGYPIQSKLLTIYIPTTVSGKMNDPTAVSANPTKEKANLHVAAGTNDLSPQ